MRRPAAELSPTDGRNPNPIARIPNPNAGNPKMVVSSEVATLEFVRETFDSDFDEDESVLT